jgi:predicted RNase H-like HicB family nuclease
MIIYLRNHAKSFTIRVTEEKQDDGGFSGQCIELPAAISQGETLEELRQNMKEAIELVLEEEESTAEPGRR